MKKIRKKYRRRRKYSKRKRKQNRRKRRSLTHQPTHFRQDEKIISETGIRSAYEKGKIEGMKRVLPISLSHLTPKIIYPPVDTNDFLIHAIIAAKNEAKTIGNVIDKALESGVHKVIVVANGCTDNTVAIAKEHKAKVLEFKNPLGYDVGRAIGLVSFPADINLILDADFILMPQNIRPFINAIAHGVDIALNDLNPLYMKYATIDHISLLKYNLNLAIGRNDLGINTLTAVPHALSRKAIEMISGELLAVPPKALVKAVLKNLNIQAVHTVDVFRPNKIRPEVHNFQGKNLVADLIIGDHLEALAYYLSHTDWRGGRTDLGRRRELIQYAKRKYWI